MSYRHYAGSILLFCVFFSRIHVASAAELPPPSWISQEESGEVLGEESLDGDQSLAEGDSLAEGSEASHGSSEEAVSNAPHEQTFIISAYYSPLPGQNRYVTGSYEGDKRLNGNGTNGADGTPVYPGMIAAPKSYAFGTKLHIPGIGTVAVHDRGGAIVHSGERGNAHDRLDVWMGFGDQGLQRALRWGKRTVTATVYGVDDSVVESIELEGYSDTERQPAPAVPEYGFDAVAADESTPDATVTTTPSEVKPVLVSQESDTPVAHAQSEVIEEIVPAFGADLKIGSAGEEVRLLQEELVRINLLGIAPTGFYGEVTEHAVYKFQQSQGLVGDKNSLGAGIFGPKTRAALNTIVAARMRTDALVAANTASMADG